MKFLKIKNRTPSTLFFAFCTISSCTCGVCKEWLALEQYPISNWPSATFGYISVTDFGERIDRFCPNWDCVGACFFGKVPTTVSKADFFDYDEKEDYKIAENKGELCFTHQAPEVNENCILGAGLALAYTAGRVALVCAGVPDVGIVGDILGFLGLMNGFGL